jgi:hypothetical protein
MYSFRYNSQIKCFRTHVDVEHFLVLVCGTRTKISSQLSVTHSIEEIILYHQCGLRREGSTIDETFCILQILEHSSTADTYRLQEALHFSLDRSIIQYSH